MALTMESLGMLLLLLTVSNLGTASEVICAYTQRDPVKEMTSITDKESEVAVPVGEILPDNKTMRCPKSTDFCYALWSEDPQNKSLTNFLAQGCWESSGGYDCEESECFSNKKPPKALNSAKFCCCQGLLCNVNVSDVYVPSSEPDIGQTAHPFIEPVSHKKEAIVIIVAIGCSLFAIFFILFLVYRLLTGLHKPNPDSLHLMEAPPPIPTTPTYDLSTLKLQEVIGRGRYGSVWRANLCDRDVAVKVFQQQHKLYYLNEKDIYTLPHLEHPCLLKFLGSEERVNGEGRTEYLIVLSYAPLGCLQDYLRNQTIDWPTLCKMSQSLAKGLAHLHTDVRKGDKVKPCITHRDLNSRNILVKLDLNCAICDMGFAMKIAGSKYYGQNGEEQYAETTSLTDVGTLRYMAPEVLEGAVNLRDCESSLKQIDVYALGLVLWEIMTRCSDLYQGLEVPEYRLPFEAEIGLHPTFEQMQVLISRNKARPLFSEVWKDSNQAVRLLKETIEDCWDQDAEARLTSLCVEERLQELPALWERHRVSMTVTGVSPTVNPTSSQLSTMRNSAINNNSTLSSTPANHELTDRNGNIPGIISLADTIILQNRDHSSFYYQQNRESSISEATAETTVTMSPSEPSSHPPQDNLTKNANTQQSSWLSSIPLQPYQGRNPCLERNMIMEPQEEISISGNTLLEKGSKYKNIASVPINRDVDVENIFDVLQLADNVESNSLVSNDVLNHSTRTCNPIPYVQNAVHGTLPARPKQPNVPGNGQHYDKKVRKGPFGGRFDKKKSSSGEQSGKKVKDWCIKTLLDRKRISRSNHSIDNNIVISNEGNVANTSNGHHRSMSDGTQNVGKSNLAAKNDETSKPVTTEVCLLQNSNNEPTQIVIRPTNGPYKSVENGYLSNGNCRTAEVGVAKLALTNLQNGQAPILKCRSSLTAPSQTNSLDHHSNLDTANSDVEAKALRPTTLPIKGHNFRVPSNMQEMMVFNSPKIRTSTEGSSSEKAALLKDYDEMDDSNPDDPKGKIARRVKTPFEIKPGRFSLCDDRMMSHGDECHHHFSLNSPLRYKRGCVSIPVDIDAVCTQLSVKFANDLRTKPADCKQTENQEIAADKMLTEKFAAAPHPPNTDFRSCVNGTVIPNGTIPSLWSTPNHNDSQNKNSEPTNKGVYRVSCL